ncbi:MAG: hypothetical protein HOQ24_15410, partial [Mycobacteriaceae bacterium]|nr:hypothetical protein [Mycobacteriaceae bacterium]
LGTAGSVLGLGGIWNAAAVPGSRTGWFAAAATAVLLGVVGTGLVALFRRGSWRIPAVRALLMLAAGSLGLIVAGATPAGLTVGQWLVERVPGTGLFRDTQKFAALAVPGYALAAAACAALVSRTTRAGSTRDLRWVASAGLCGAVIAVLPDLAFGVGGNLRPVTYPAGWGQVAAAARAVDGDVAVLPAGMFRRFRYSGSAPVLDPAPRMLPKAVLQTGALPVAGRTVAGESRHAATVESALLHGDSRQRLAALGVGAVLVEHGTPGPSGRAAATLAQLRPLYSDADLTLYAVANPVVRPAPRRELVYLAHGLWAAALLLGATALLPRVRRRASSRMTEAVTNLQNDP